MAEKFWYHGLGFQRFDAVDQIIGALYPPPVCNNIIDECIIVLLVQQ